MTIQEEGRRFRDAIQVFVRNGFTLKEAESEFRAALINAVLTQCHGNQTRAAAALRIHRNTLSRRIARLRATDRLEAVLRPRWQSRKTSGRAHTLQRLVGGPSAA